MESTSFWNRAGFWANSKGAEVISVQKTRRIEALCENLIRRNYVTVMLKKSSLYKRLNLA